MYRTAKHTAFRRIGVSAVLAVGAAAVGVGISGASSGPAAPTTHQALAVDIHPSTSSESTGVGATAPTSLTAHDATLPASEDVSGVITQVTSSSITIHAESGTSPTFAIDATTVVTAGDVASSASSLAVGQSVSVTASGTTATGIDIDLTHFEGVVVSASGNTIVITNSAGVDETILTSATTTFTMNDASATLADVTVGASIHAEGITGASANSMNAVRVTIAPSASTVPSGSSTDQVTRGNEQTNPGSQDGQGTTSTGTTGTSSDNSGSTSSSAGSNESGSSSINSNTGPTSDN